MRALVAEGALGAVLAARSAWLSSLVPSRRTWRVTNPAAGAGVVMDLTVHDVDTLRYVLDDEIAEVAAMTAGHGVAEGAIEDGVAGTMRTAGGVLIAFQDAFTLGHGGTALEIHGTDGTLVARDLFGPGPDGDVFLRRGGDVQPVEIAERRNAYERGVEAFARAIAGAGAPAATADDGIASLAVALAVLDAARTGRTVAVAAQPATDRL
jgi:1,5-anhydro-D-fructose reductase (1,5-anhydro-D-mannitol-forming)